MTAIGNGTFFATISRDQFNELLSVAQRGHEKGIEWWDGIYATLTWMDGLGRHPAEYMPEDAQLDLTLLQPVSVTDTEREAEAAARAEAEAHNQDPHRGVMTATVRSRRRPEGGTRWFVTYDRE